MPYTKTRQHVTVDWRGPAFEAGIEGALVRALQETGQVVAGLAQNAPHKYRIESILATVGARAVRRGRRGLYLAVTARDFRAVFFEQGTSGRRRHALAKSTIARRSSPSGQARQQRYAGNPGVKPQRFLRYALKVGWPIMLEQIGRNLRDVDSRIQL